MGGQSGCMDKLLQLGKSSISVQTYRRVFTITIVRRTNIRDDGKTRMCILGSIKFWQYKMASMSTTPPLPGCPPHSHLRVLHSQHCSLSFKIQKTAVSFYISVPTDSHSMHAMVGIFSQEMEVVLQKIFPQCSFATSWLAEPTASWLWLTLSIFNCFYSFFLP